MRQIAKQTAIIDSSTFITQYTYDMNGNIKTMTYPDNRIVTYSYSDNKPTDVTTTYSGAINNIATGITYKPFGGISGLTYGNGIAKTIGYDNQYRISTITSGAVQNLTYGYDANGNITGITNNLDIPKKRATPTIP